MTWPNCCDIVKLFAVCVPKKVSVYCQWLLFFYFRWRAGPSFAAVSTHKPFLNGIDSDSQLHTLGPERLVQMVLEVLLRDRQSDNSNNGTDLLFLCYVLYTPAAARDGAGPGLGLMGCRPLPCGAADWGERLESSESTPSGVDATTTAVPESDEWTVCFADSAATAGHE